MIYATGSYIMKCKKEWECLECNNIINLSEFCLNRMSEYGETK